MVEHKNIRINKAGRVYGDVVSDVLRNGLPIVSRNGKTYSLPAASFGLGIDKAKDLIISLRKMHTKGIEGEFKTLIDPTPLTNVSQFEANGCNYWKNWAGPNGELNLDYHNKLHPAWEELQEQIGKDPYDRRHVISLWSNTQAERAKLSLPSCWYSLQFVSSPSEEFDNVINLSLVWTQRSVDVAIGLPSDMYLAGLFLEEMCKKASEHSKYTFKPYNVYFALANVHIYEEHRDKCIKMLTEPNPENVIKFEIKE